MRRRPGRRNPSEGTEALIGWALAAGLLGLGAYAVTQTEWVRLSRLEPETRRRMGLLLDRLRARGIEVMVGSTNRTETEQAKLVAEGKSGATVSWHLVGRAADVYPLIPGTTKPDWEGKIVRPENYRIMHQEWAKLGGFGLAYSPYPDGPIRLISTTKGKKWDGGHLEFHGPFATASAAYKALKAA